MEIQNNPYLIWQLVPAFITLGLGIYVQSRPRKIPESNVLAILLLAGSFWSLMNAFQLASPNYSWQLFWHLATFLAIAITPTAWFLLAVKFTGFFRTQIEKVQGLFLVIPALTIVASLTNGYHKLFFSSFKTITINGFTTITGEWGILFYIHTFYSYTLLFLGVLFLGIALIKNFKNYGARAYGLILGVLTPLIANIFYLFGGLPAGFPDPTPISFTITGITFAWAIFAGRMLQVVPIAHESVVVNLTAGIVVLDLKNKILDINPAAMEILGLSLANPLNHPLLELLDHDPVMAKTIQAGLAQPPVGKQDMLITTLGGKNTYDLRISGIPDKHGRYTGRLLQFTDISQQKHVEENLASTKEGLTSILDSLKDYYFETDVNGVVTNINQAFCEHLGYSRKDDVLGKHFRHFTDRASARQVFQNFSKVIEKKKTVELFRYYYHTKDGRLHIGETTVSPMFEGDTVIGARGVLRDITERVKSEAILRQTKEEVEARAEELAAINRIAMLSNQSLNLNNILNTLCAELTHIFPVRNAGIGLLSANKASLEIVAFHSIDPDEESALGMILPFEGNLAFRHVIEKKRTILIQDSQKDHRTKLLADLSELRGTKSIMIVPLLTRGNAIGTIRMPAKDPNHIFDEKEIKLAEIIASQIAAAIDNAQLFAQVEKALDVAERDLEIGRQIQSGFFPETIPDIPGWEMAAHFEAARQVSGDFYDFFKFKDSNMTALVIADVCDKGVGAALFMVLFRSLLRAFSKIDINPANVEECLKKIILNTNDYIAGTHGNSYMFATIFFGILDPETGILYYVNGGHEPPAMLNKEGKLIRRLAPTGPAVGIFADAGYQVEKVEFTKGDFLVGFTDGMKDAQDKEGRIYSEERLLQYLQTPWTSLFSMIFELKTELRNFMNGYRQYDDITLISIRRKLTPDSEQHAICRIAEMKILSELQDFVTAAAEQSELNEDDAFALKLATEEACTNIIQYGFEGREPGLISIFFEKDADKARVIIRDDGQFFPPAQVEISDLEAGWEERPVGGLGIYLVKKMVDNFSYSRMLEKGNQLILEKKIYPQSEERGNI